MVNARRGVRRINSRGAYVRNNWGLYVMMLPALLYVVVYKFLPLFGLTIAFKNLNLFAGTSILDSIIKSEWAGLKYFRQFFGSPDFRHVLGNTLIISLYKLVFLFPLPIILAILLNEMRQRRLKRTVQTLIYMPHFLSWVVIYGIFFMLLSNDGVVNKLITSLGGTPQSFFLSPKRFRGLLVFTAGWKESGWGTIVYLAAITGVDPEIHEAATIDGASRFQRMRYVTFPSILPVVSLMLIMQLGKILEAGFEQVLVMYNPVVYSVGDIIQTYVYRMGLGRMNYSLATAVGLFESVVSFVLVVSSNSACKRLFGRSIW